MKVIVATEARLFADKDGVIKAPTQGRSYPFWTRYLDVFEEVLVLARVSKASEADGHSVEGAGVSVLPITDFSGSVGVARGWLRARSEIARWSARHPDAALVGRLPGIVGGLLVSDARCAGHAYALEVVGEPFSAVTSSGLAGKASRPLARVARRQMQRQVRLAGAVSYVTRTTLQGIYPSGSGAATASYSSVELPDGAFQERGNLTCGLPPNLVMVGTMSQSYKGHDVLLEAMTILASEGQVTRAILVGDGRLRAELGRIVDERALDVCFTGQLASSEEVRKVLDGADLFVMPSRSEGLPRALIEAMARGLPAIGTTVGGIPELLAPESLVPSDDPEALAAAISLHLFDEDRRIKMSTRNREVAAAYHQDKLALARRDFYTAVRDQVEHRLNQRRTND